MTEAGPGPTAGTPSGALPERAIAGRYRLGAPLGAGGSAQVFRATDRVLGRDVALKLFPATLEPADRDRQQRELALLAELHHPNLVDLFDAGEDDGRLYLVMRLVDGESLADRIARAGPAPLPVAMQLGAELAGALAHVHGHGITHRDVKPANVFLGERPMLGDFGIARAADAPQVTHTGFVIGTPAYMAPEQVRGHTVGPPADVYAFGLVLLETITGHRAFGGTGVETAMARLTRPPEIPPLPDGLDALIARMTDLDPAARPPASAVATELAAAASRLDATAAVAPAALAAGPAPTRVGPPVTAAAAAPAATRVATAAGTAGAGGAAGFLAGRRRVVLLAAVALAAVVLVAGVSLAGGDSPAPSPAAPAPSSAVPSATPAASPSAVPAPVTTEAPSTTEDSGGDSSAPAAGSGPGNGDTGNGNGNDTKTPKEPKAPKPPKNDG